MIDKEFARRLAGANQNRGQLVKTVLADVNRVRIARGETQIRSLAELNRETAADEYFAAEVKEIVDDVEQRTNPQETLETFGEVREREQRAGQGAAPVIERIAPYTSEFNPNTNATIAGKVLQHSVVATEPEVVAARTLKSEFGRHAPDKFFDAVRDGALSRDDIEPALRDNTPPNDDDESVDPIPQQFQERAAKANVMAVKDLGRLINDIHVETNPDND